MNKKNAYLCTTCSCYIVTIDRDEGVTPMFIACRVLGEPDDPENTCKGQMCSMGYPRPEVWPDWIKDRLPAWEWYTPDSSELVTMNEGMQEHIAKGGLALRKIM